MATVDQETIACQSNLKKLESGKSLEFSYKLPVFFFLLKIDSHFHVFDIGFILGFSLL